MTSQQVGAVIASAVITSLQTPDNLRQFVTPESWIWCYRLYISGAARGANRITNEKTYPTKGLQNDWCLRRPPASLDWWRHKNWKQAHVTGT